MEIFTLIAIFIISIGVLVKATDYLLEGAERVGVYFDIKPFIIGVFILGLGTSLPELIISILSVFEGASEIIIGNVVGSNIANVFLVLGIAAIIVKKAEIDLKGWDFDLPLFVASAFFLTITAWNGVFSITEGAFFLGAFITYIIYTLTNHRKRKKVVPEELEEIEEEIKKEKKIGWEAILKIAVTPFLIYLGARYTVESTIQLADIFGIGREIIAATAISIGTSLPELAVSLLALKKKKIDELVGNVVGSNIFNILLVMGFSSMFGAITIPASILTFALPMMLVATAVAFLVIEDGEITRWEGGMLLVFYLFFLAELVNLFCITCI